ncbi:hypothetical protein N7532_007522 [Penicillium argentinense]|uniref:Survival motor neuron Tudor domain-containing protein n=1 Tax=Penicillium argentinense TaxID=1131581 RepID=A0A9W9F804_9EURO|nr:uncharacterized protein N7532_007522 [Penicillium argentinense]KAJ5095231.1 hypothetical protein N7532_007522 [Penicillium argentinense]
MANSKESKRAEPMWDDDGIAASWDSVYQEYQRYHSIAARGENVEEVLRKAQEAETAQQDDTEQHDQAEDEVTDETDKAELEHALQTVESETEYEPQDIRVPPGPKLPAGSSKEAPIMVDTPSTVTSEYGYTTLQKHLSLTPEPHEDDIRITASYRFLGYYTALDQARQKRRRAEASNDGKSPTHPHPDTVPEVVNIDEDCEIRKRRMMSEFWVGYYNGLEEDRHQQAGQGQS